MKKYLKRIFIILGIFIVLATGAFAGVRLDLALDVPFYFGINLNNSGGGDFSEYTFLFPEIDINYLFELGPVNIGLGIRMFTLILESIAWPNLMVEFEFKPIILSAQIGGGGFAIFGILSTTVAAPIILMDVAAAVKLADWFRCGVGVLMIGENDETVDFSDQGIIPFTIYAFGKFSFEF